MELRDIRIDLPATSTAAAVTAAVVAAPPLRAALKRAKTVVRRDRPITDSEMLEVGLGSQPAALAPGGGEEQPGPTLVLEYLQSRLPESHAQLPEFNLGHCLLRPMHCYAHGGFMGLAISLLADDVWKDVLIRTAKEISTGIQEEVMSNIKVREEEESVWCVCVCV